MCVGAPDVLIYLDFIHQFENAGHMLAAAEAELAFVERRDSSSQSGGAVYDLDVEASQRYASLQKQIGDATLDFPRAFVNRLRPDR